MSGNGSLADFRAGFAVALFGPGEEARGAPFDQPAFAVYRNTARRGAIEALAANYPTVGQIVGEDWLRAATAVYAEQHWPRSPVLLGYGDQFPDFLAGFPPAAELPYLPGVARLDRAWTECHLASDAPALTMRELAAVGRRVARARLMPHPAARWFWCDGAPAFALWQRHREARSLDDVVWQSDGALLTRPAGRVNWQPLARAGAALLTACATGAMVSEALDCARQIAPEPAVEPASLLASLVNAGAFTALHPDT